MVKAYVERPKIKSKFKASGRARHLLTHDDISDFAAELEVWSSWTQKVFEKAPQQLSNGV